jgi:signal transduction histidine kinase
MVMNLLDNAIKYTPPGGHVELHTATEDGRYTLDVIDTGAGIPPEAQARLFDRFYRARIERPDGDGGAGLGLAIARWIAESHGGTIALVRSEATGSTFRVALPVTRAAAPSAAEVIASTGA